MKQSNLTQNNLEWMKNRVKRSLVFLKLKKYFKIKKKPLLDQ